jgi:CBS domain-containing protein
MRENNRITKPQDRLLKMQGKLDRGPVDFKSHLVEREGEIMAIATRDVVTVPPTTSIVGAVETMTKCGFRRLPITDAGTGKLRGIVTAGDIINFMGGGDKSRLIEVKHGGNFLAAINESVREIMTQKPESIPETARIDEVVDIIVTKKTGGIPIVSTDGILTGIVTERDVMRALATEKCRLSVEDVMSRELRVTSPESPICTVTREMTGHRFRRLPVVSEDVLFGIVTTTDIMKYLGTGEVFRRLVTGDVAEVMGLPVRTLMTASKLITTNPEKNVNDAARQMLENGVGALPVIENSRLIGLVTEFDLVKAFARR